MFIIIIGALFLTACGGPIWGPSLTPEQQAAMERQQAKEEAKEQAARAQEIIARYQPMCTQLGFKTGTPAFARCVLHLYQNDQAAQTNRRAAAAAILGARRTTECNQFGSSITCNTW
ncbi:MAG: hypothetical protein ACYCQK_02690 [Acidiferrobacteraceae bacterium]